MRAHFSPARTSVSAAFVRFEFRRRFGYQLGYVRRGRAVRALTAHVRAERQIERREVERDYLAEQRGEIFVSVFRVEHCGERFFAAPHYGERFILCAIRRGVRRGISAGGRENKFFALGLARRVEFTLAAARDRDVRVAVHDAVARAQKYIRAVEPDDAHGTALRGDRRQRFERV